PELPKTRCPDNRRIEPDAPAPAPARFWPAPYRQMRQASSGRDGSRRPWPSPASVAELIWKAAPLVTSSSSVVYGCSAGSFPSRSFCLLIRERGTSPFLRQAAADIHLQVTYIDVHCLLGLAPAHPRSA